MTYETAVPAELEGTRLDACASKVSGLTRSRVQHLIEDGCVTVDGSVKAASYKVKAGQRLVVLVPEVKEVDIVPQAIALDVVYEDSDIIVVNKQRGLVVHPAAGNPDGTLVNALLEHCGDLAGIGGEKRPGIVHRIDKDTTGLIVAAKNDEAYLSLAEQIRTRNAHRIYSALVEGRVTQGGAVDAPIGRSHKDRKKMAVVPEGRNALTKYSVIEAFDQYTLLREELDTGRTHQIRVHMAHIGHPVVGDKTYGVKKQRFDLEGQLLHAGELLLNHPRTDERMHFKAPLPADFEHVLAVLRKMKQE